MTLSDCLLQITQFVLEGHTDHYISVCNIGVTTRVDTKYG